jgi:DNA-binding CsgD family transcriptional regulator
VVGEIFKQRLSQCRERDTLRALVEQDLCGAFGAARGRLFYFEDWTEQLAPNPVFEFLRRDECAVHEAQLVDNATWRRYCPRADHGHVLVGPLIAAGCLIGVVAVTRTAGDGAFDSGDLRRMNQLTLYLSSQLGAIEARPRRTRLAGLTPRESEVAWEVSAGRRNSEIASALGVTEQTVKQNLKSIYRKLGVRGRTQLALLVVNAASA